MHEAHPQIANRAVAVEQEGYGVMRAAHEAQLPALVIRGVSDLKTYAFTSGDSNML